MEYFSVNQPHAKGIKAVPGEQQDHAQYCLYKQHWFSELLELEAERFCFQRDHNDVRDLLSKPSPWPTWPLLSHRVRSYLSQVRAKIDMITMLASESKHRKEKL